MEKVNINIPSQFFYQTERKYNDSWGKMWDQNEFLVFKVETFAASLQVVGS